MPASRPVAVALVTAALLTAAVSHAQEAVSRPASQLVYLLVARTPVRSAPSLDAPIVAELQPLDVLLGEERIAGWIRIVGGAFDVEASGDLWLPVVRDNVLSDDFERIQRRTAKLRFVDWPLAVKIDVMRGVVRPGFTAAQVRLAIGDPREKLLREEDGDVFETWRYPDRLIVFSHTSVESVEKLESPH